MNTSFSSKEVIRSSWQIFKKNWRFIFLAGIATVVVEILLQLVQKGAQRSGAIIDLIAAVFVIIIGIIVSIGWSKVLLLLTRTNHATWTDFESDAPVWLRYFKTAIWLGLYMIGYMIVAVIPFGIIALIGFLTHVKILAMIGGILAYIAFIAVLLFVAIRYQFYRYAVIDYPGFRSKAIFKKSGEITKGHFWKLVVFNLVLALMNLVGLLCLGVGLIITIPVSKLASTKVYEILKQRSTASQHSTHSEIA